MAFRIIEGSEVNSNRSSHTLRDGEIAIDGNTMYIGDGSTPGGVQINAASSSASFEIHNQTTKGSTDSGNPTVLPAGKDMYIFNYATFGSLTYYTLPDGTEVGQKIHLCAPYNVNLGSHPQMTDTNHNGSSTISITISGGDKNFEMIWVGTYWIFSNSV